MCFASKGTHIVYLYHVFNEIDHLTNLKIALENSICLNNVFSSIYAVDFKISHFYTYLLKMEVCNSIVH